jgi:small subunit ribosomal protein S18
MPAFKRRRRRKKIISRKKKFCRICSDKIAVDYKEPALLSHYVTEAGKIVPRRITGACAKHQREITTAVKRARILALLPFSSQRLAE